MGNRKHIFLALVLLASFGIQKAFAAFIIDDGSSKKDNKYTLKQLHREEAPFSLTTINKKKWTLDGVSSYSNIGLTLPPVNAVPMNSVEIQSPVTMQKGHTLYIYNFKYKVPASNPLPMFKTPSRADYR